MSEEFTNIETIPDSDGEPRGIQKEYPPDQTPVLVLYRGYQWRIGAMDWEHPTWEDTYKSFPYWHDPYNDMEIWEWDDIYDWMPLPEIPNPESP